MSDSSIGGPSPVTLQYEEIFPNKGTDTYLEISEWKYPLTFFVGRNGTGKSRSARRIAQAVSGRLLSTDRLSSITAYQSYGWTFVPSHEGHRGIPLDDGERNSAKNVSAQFGTGIEEMYILRDEPDVGLRVAAFLRTTLKRDIVLRENSGFLDPHIRVNNVEYSLLREEGHGLKELVLLLTATYRRDWKLLVVDEPELHLHPSMARLWLNELEVECRTTGRRALVVTHEPNLIKPRQCEDLGAIWHFSHERPPLPIMAHVDEDQQSRITSSLRINPQLVSSLVFTPRPVLVEGIHDVAALTTAVSRICPPEVIAQTDFIDCGGSGGVALWFEVSKKMGLDVRAVADLDAMFATEVQRTMDRDSLVTNAYRTELSVEPPKTSKALRPLIEEMNKQGVLSNEKSRAAWLAANVDPESGHYSRREKLLTIWQQSGIWLHPQGTLEAVLGVEDKGKLNAELAASIPGPIDMVATWCAYQLDKHGDIEQLLNAAIERIAHAIMEALRLSPDARFSTPIGGTARSDSRLVEVTPKEQGMHRITVISPPAFVGYWLEFSRSTPSDQLVLQPPSA